MRSTTGRHGPYAVGYRRATRKLAKRSKTVKEEQIYKQLYKYES